MYYNVYQTIITPESAAHGEADSQAPVLATPSLREAIETVCETRTAEVDGVHAIECSDYPVRAGSWVTVYNGGEYITGAHESRSLHFSNATASSVRRVARLLGAYGV